MALLDSFTAADGTALSARSGEGTDWTKIAGTGDMAIQTNRLHSSGVSDVYYVSTFVPSSADYDVVVPATQITAPTEYGQMFLGRADPAAHTYLAVRHVGFGLPRVQLLERVAGAWLELGLAESPGTGELRLRMLGDQISVLVEGAVVIGPITSQVTAAGRIGFLSWAEVTATTGVHFDSVSHEAIGGATATETLLPDTLVASSGLTGGLADIDEDPDTPDAAWMVATANNVNTSARVGFPTPTGNPTGVQTFKAYARKFSTNSGNPTALIELWENGTLLASGATVNVTSTTGQLITQTFDLAGITLTDPTGAGVEARFSSTAAGGNPSTRNSADLGALNWDTVTYAVAGDDTTPPTTTLGNQTRTVISRVPGWDAFDVTITADEAFVEYELRRVPASTSTRTEGAQVETAVVASTTSLTTTVTDDELIDLGGASEGDNTVKAFTKDAAGNWST